MKYQIIPLHPDIDSNPKMASIRDGYGEGLLSLGESDKNIVVLTGDLSESTRVDKFAKKYPERFFNVGVAEQNMAGIASGLGVSGKIPFISSYAAFSPGRNWEQIRTTIAYNNSNVKIAGHHAGVSTGPDGATHQAIEDIATMRVMPNMIVIVPSDAIEARKATIASAHLMSPVYLRFARNPSPLVTDESSPFVPGKANLIYHSKHQKNVLIIACGPLVYEAYLSAIKLNDLGIGVSLLNSHTIKPLDNEQILALTDASDLVVSVEEHSVIGGLGGAVAELLTKECPKKMIFIGMQDIFGESGEPNELRKKYELDHEAITKKIVAFFKSK